ncbi:MAG: response regulator [Candidatus Taylorbacteria bacterium]|nr:response regulator [Candidatus Taylorbacteria bacterium]
MKEKILIALSDVNLINVLTEQLKIAGYVCSSVSNGNEVINQMKILKPDLLLIDTVMPNKSGYDVLNEKSFDKDVTRIPVIIISNAGEPIHMKQIPSTPVIKDYVVKSHVEPSEVLQKIEKAFGRGPVAEKIETTPIETGKGKTVLWVEDDKLLGSILSKKFQMTGYKLLKAVDGTEALKLLDTNMPDVILLDIMIPGAMNGVDILTEIRKRENFKNVPVIMLSNLNKESDLERARKLGANKFLVKATISLDEIIAEVDKLIK